MAIRKTKKISIIILTIFLLGGIIFAVDSLEKDKTLKTKSEKELSKEKYEEDVKKVTCDTLNFQIVDLKVDWKCDLSDICTYSYGLNIEGNYVELEYEKHFTYVNVTSKAELFSDLQSLYNDKLEDNCQAKKEKLKKDYEYTVKVK